MTRFELRTTRDAAMSMRRRDDVTLARHVDAFPLSADDAMSFAMFIFAYAMRVTLMFTPPPLRDAPSLLRLCRRVLPMPP